jgi:hypothetical protein
MKREFTKNEINILNDKKIKSNQKRNERLLDLPISQKSSDISIYRVWKKDKSSLITRFNETYASWNELCDDLGIVQEARIIENLQKKITEQINEVNSSKLNLRQQQQILEELDKKYVDCLGDLNNAKSKIEEYFKPILVVEDKFIEIYKIGYLKVKNIDFNENNLNEIFEKEAPFAIRRSGGAGSVRGFLNMATIDGYEEKKVIGLFDYDKEGSENFYHLKKKSDGEWNDSILGTKNIGYARKRRNHPCFYSLILPIPDRLNHLTSDVAIGRFESYVEIENLINPESLMRKNCVIEENVLDKTYLKIKESAKSKALIIYSDLPTSDFDDFIPLYDRIFKLFQIS